MTYPRIEFEMELRRSAALVVGCLRFWGFDGQEVLALEASSGMPRFQDFGHWMLKGKGPIPPSRLLPVGVDWELATLPEMRPNDKGIEGPFYRISPNSIEICIGLMRDGFGFHKDRNVVGTLGCVFPVEPTRQADLNFLECEKILKQWNAAGFKSVPFVVRYL